TPQADPLEGRAPLSEERAGTPRAPRPRFPWPEGRRFLRRRLLARPALGSPAREALEGEQPGLLDRQDPAEHGAGPGEYLASGGDGLGGAAGLGVGDPQGSAGGGEEGG